MILKKRIHIQFYLFTNIHLQKKILKLLNTILQYRPNQWMFKMTQKNKESKFKKTRVMYIPFQIKDLKFLVVNIFMWRTLSSIYFKPSGQRIFGKWTIDGKSK